MNICTHMYNVILVFGYTSYILMWQYGKASQKVDKIIKKVWCVAHSLPYTDIH